MEILRSIFNIAELVACDSEPEDAGIQLLGAFDPSAIAVEEVRSPQHRLSRALIHDM